MRNISVAVALLVTACGSSLPGSIDRSAEPGGGIPAGPLACLSAGDLTHPAEIYPDLLPDQATLAAWQSYMVHLGPRYDGSPSLKSWHDFVAAQFASRGLEVKREPITLDWWDHKHWSLKLIQNGVETDVPVASFFPYSGHTPVGGVTAELADAGMGLPADLTAAKVGGKIAYIETHQIPTNMAIFYADASYIYDPDQTITPLTDYTRMSLSFLLTPQLLSAPMGSLSFAHDAGALATVLSLDASLENAAGQYTPFSGWPGSSFDEPALFVDRDTGAMLKQKIAEGAQARLELAVDEHLADTTDDIIATLPGSTGEVVIVNTHSDGPSSAEENGAIGLMALAQYFSSLPQVCRQRTMVFVLTPGHFYGGINGDTGRFIGNHPEIIARAIGSVTTEHLGQMEWLDDAQGYHPSGLPEPGIFFGSPAPAVQELLHNAVVAEDLRRVIISRPVGVDLIYFGVGSALNTAGVPNGGYLTGPHSMLSFADDEHLNHVSYERMAAEVRVFARAAAAFDGADKTVLCAGMPPSSTGKATGCYPFFP